MELNKVIVRPLITEKSMALAKEGKYTFEVNKKAFKKDVQKAISEAFGVEVIKVNLFRKAKKRKRVGRLRKKFSNLSFYKKAIVKVKEGQKIDIFEEK
ncbi:50S ribosomal protein L23 [Candidatus Beckwithbacteria bacterium CG10_big_fil_rev_8_21_14_0_10_34_10]|uniref:Large ribosomal subunit protein uL23 n=1 Tax=Candidatus Beckwithbacteria bacterium CG10_big_fil_rev_8_21_14_0_10_34_10 TaxID=1974495 RepID=A0A2H0W9V3_9BACT|nr:MAG: 50S ribosomal protein L23 [Candidatus Beckwithbacteria bacterium CG10_big_fil_rev_8_21_14_0_10_34_10]